VHPDDAPVASQFIAAAFRCFVTHLIYTLGIICSTLKNGCKAA
jgi:hypothetical protein